MGSLVHTLAGVDIANGGHRQELRRYNRQQNSVSLPNYMETRAGFQGLSRPTASSPSTAGRPPQHLAAQEETAYANGSPDCYSTDTDELVATWISYRAATIGVLPRLAPDYFNSRRLTTYRGRRGGYRAGGRESDGDYPVRRRRAGLGR